MIIIGPEIFRAQDRGGISKSFIELFNEALLMRCDWHIWTSTDQNIHLRKLLQKERISDNVHGFPVPGNREQLSWLFGSSGSEFMQFCRDKLPNIIHHSYYSAFSNTPKGIKQIETLHDLCDEQFTTTLDLKSKIRSKIKFLSLERADAIVCVSQSTKSALEEYRPHLARKAVVIPHGIRKHSLLNVTRPLDWPYFLYVGKRGGYKNFETIAQALSRSQPLKEHQLICFGGGQAANWEIQRLRDLGIAERVIFVSGDDELLDGYYRHAVALVYPSFYEGFGLPLLEAMANRCPVLSSDTTSLPEVGGRAPLYAPPSEVEAWQHNMEEIASDHLLRAQLISRGAERVKKFSWQAAVGSHNLLYQAC